MLKSFSSKFLSRGLSILIKSVGLPIFPQFLPSRKQSLPARSAQGITREGKRNLFIPDYNLTVFHILNSQIQPGRAFLFSSLLG